MKAPPPADENINWVEEKLQSSIYENANTHPYRNSPILQKSLAPWNLRELIRRIFLTSFSCFPCVRIFCARIFSHTPIRFIIENGMIFIEGASTGLREEN